MIVYRSEMRIFFGSGSGNVLGNVTVKRPFSMIALICSSCTMSVHIHSMMIRKRMTYLYTLRELKGARELAMEAFA